MFGAATTKETNNKTNKQNRQQAATSTSTDYPIMVTTDFISSFLRSCASPPQLSAGGPSNVATGFRNPNAGNQVSNMRTYILQLSEECRPKNSSKSYDGKVAEFFQFCDLVFPMDPYKYCLNFDKVYKFMFYQSFREKKAYGGNKDHIRNGIYFDKEAYDLLAAAFSHVSGEDPVRPDPKDPIGPSCFGVYKATLKKIYKVQIAQGFQSQTWDMIWQEALDQIAKHVKERKPKHKKLNYHEKLDGTFAPYLIAEEFHNIEAEFWRDSQTTCGKRNICANLRHRYGFLHLTAGILRCESLHRAEFSDFLGIFLPKQETHIHPMFIMINQITQGKTNHGRTLYGRATRHKNVLHCAVGALAMYLMYRFMCTQEFTHFTVENWANNKDWFDIKLLTDINSGDRTKEMKNDSYGKHVKRILQRLRICCKKILHLGRNLGSRTLELLEEEADSIRAMGQWDPSQFDKAYSAKLPIGPMRSLAGFSSTNKIYFNTRTVIDPPEELLHATPIGTWAYNALDDLAEVSADGANQTAMHFLRFMQQINKIFLQDMAVIQLYHPERAGHPMYRDMEVFEMDEWEQFKATMKNAIDTEECPLDANLEKVIPGMHQWQQANHTALGRVSNELRDFRNSMEDFKTDVGSRMAVVEATVQQSSTQQAELLARQQRALAITMWRAAHTLLEHSGGAGGAAGQRVEEAFMNEVDAARKDFTERATEPSSPGGASLLEGTQQQAESPGTPPATPQEDDPKNHSTFRMKVKHTRLIDMYNEWFGLEEFDDGHGGVEGRDKKFGAKWRKGGFIDVQQHSRTKRIVQAIDKLARDDDLTSEEAAEQLQPLFDKCRHSLSNMIKECQHMGHIPKKAVRGKKSKAAISENTSSQ